MTKNQRSIVFLFCVLTLMTSCRPEIDFVENSFRAGQSEMSFNAGNIAMNFPSGAGSASLELNATKQWTASFSNDRAKEWCSLSTESGKRGVASITVTVKANEEYDQRSAAIYFTCGDVKRTINVTQKQKDALLVTSDRIDVGKDGGDITIEVKANISFDYAVSENATSWLVPVGTKSLTTSRVVFHVTANEEIEKREGLIRFTSSAGNEEVKIYQEGATPTIVLSRNEVEMSAEGGSFNVEINTNVNVEVEITESCNWIHEVSTKSMSTHTYQFMVDENLQSEDRVCDIVFQNTQYSMSDTVHVCQGVSQALLSFEQMYLPGVGGSCLIKMAGHRIQNFSVVSAPEWLSVGEFFLAENYVAIPITILANNAPNDREGLVKIAYRLSDNQVEVSITQHVRMPSVSYTCMGEQVAAPLLHNDSENAIIYWGDGSYENYHSMLTHSFAENGVHTITVSASIFPSLRVTRMASEVFFDFSQLNNE